MMSSDPQGLPTVTKPPSQSLVRWSTDSIPPADRFAYHEDALARAIVPLRISSRGPAAFHTEIAKADAGPLSVLHLKGSPHCVSRGQAEIARSSGHYFHLVIERAAAWNLAHRGLTRLGPGDAALIDSEIDQQIECPSRYDMVNLTMSEAWLLHWLPSPAGLVGRRMSAESGWTRALTSFVSHLSPQVIVDSPLPASLLADQVGALLALVAAELRGEAARPATAPQKALRDRIKDLVVQRCIESSLVGNDVATSLDISTRTLHRTLAAFGETFAGLLIAARADTAMRMLESPLFRRLTLDAIARRTGFSDASHFCRVIRTRFGQTPSQVRRRR
jgi:AraC family transcriptional activator of tynA and feaB